MSSKRPHEGSMSNKRQRSEVWGHFNKTPDGRANCKYCGKSLGAISTRGTSHLKRHPCIKNRTGDVGQPLTLESDHETVGDVGQIVTLESTHEARNFGDVGQPVTLESNHEARNVGLTRDAIWKWKYEVERAIRKDVLFNSSDRKKIWSDLTGLMDIEEEISRYYELEKKKLAIELKNLTSRVSFSFQVMEELGYISITAHFINEDFNLTRRLIGFKKLDDLQSESCIVDAIKNCISDWKLGDKIFTFIGGDKWKFGNDPDGSDMKKRLQECFSSKHFLKGRFITSGCRKEAVTNLYTYCIGPLCYHENSNIGKFVIHVKEVRNRIVIFNDLAEQKGLPPINKDWLSEYAGCSLDVDSKDPVHWKPAIKMFEEARRYRDVFNRYAEIAGRWMTVDEVSSMLDNGHSSQLDSIYISCPDTQVEVGESPLSNLNMCSIDWKRVEEAVHFSDLMLKVIDGLSTSNYPTSNLYIPNLVQIEDIMSKISKSIEIENSSERIYDLAYEYSWFTEVTSDDIFEIANALDPRYKLIFAEYNWKEKEKENKDLYHYWINEGWIHIREDYEDIFCTYANDEMNEGSPECIENTNTQEQGSPSNSPHMIHGKLAKFYEHVKEIKKTRKSEWYKYLGDELVELDDASFNILTWWKQNRSQYPVLSRMARDILAVPTCVHSIESNISSDFRLLKDVSPEVMEAVICSKDWILSDVQSVPEMGN